MLRKDLLTQVFHRKESICDCLLRCPIGDINLCSMEIKPEYGCTGGPWSGGGNIFHACRYTLGNIQTDNFLLLIGTCLCNSLWDRITFLAKTLCIPDSRKRDDEFSPHLAEPPEFY